MNPSGCDVAGGSCVQGISQRFQHPQAQREIFMGFAGILLERTKDVDGKYISQRVFSSNYDSVVLREHLHETIILVIKQLFPCKMSLNLTYLTKCRKSQQ